MLEKREQPPIDGFRFSVVAQLLQDLGVLNQRSVEPPKPRFVFSFIQRDLRRMSGSDSAYRPRFR